MILPLEHPDNLHRDAARGWMELGDHIQANDELEKITPSCRAHPDVLEIRWFIYAKEQKWAACLDIAEAILKLDQSKSQTWIHRSVALSELKRPKEALENLLPVVNQFPEEWIIPYNLANYCMELGRRIDAEQWFRKAMEVGGHEARQAALNDPDLRPIWDTPDGPSPSS